MEVRNDVLEALAPEFSRLELHFHFGFQEQCA
jgi:hypothetical protein